MTDTTPTFGFANDLWDASWYDGSAVPSNSLFPRVLPVNIGGHLYNTELAKLRMTTMQVRRVALDDSVEPGEQSLNAAGVWPRAQDNWFLGAGQEYLDNRFAFETVYTHSGEYPSVRTRFWRSKGVVINTEGQLTLQQAQGNIYASTNTNLTVLACESYLYVADGATLKWTNDPTASSPTFTTVATAAHNITSLTTDGYRVWAATGASGVYVTNAGSSTWTAAATPAALLTPQAVLATIATGGTVGSDISPSTTYTYYVTAVDSFNNETTASGGSAAAQSATAYPVTVAWAPNTNATYFNVYRKTASGSINFLAQVDSSVLSYSDDGTVAETTSQHPPISNNTGNTAYPATFVAYCSGHLIGSTGADLVEIEANGSITFIYNFPNPQFVWNFAFATPTAIHVGGAANGVPYVGAIQPDPATEGATLAPPTTATVLPIGEVPNAIAYNAGSIVLGTSMGVRTGSTPASDGTFDINPVITDAPNVLCLADWENFCYYGWTNFNVDDTDVFTYDVTSTGLGKLDLSQFTNPGVPAYTTDVMATDGVTGNVTSVTMLGGVPYFTVQGVGVWGPTGNYVANGWLETGWVRYSTLENKIVTRGTVLHEPILAGQGVDIDIYNMNGDVQHLGTSDGVGETGPLGGYFSADYQVGTKFMVVLTLFSSNPASTPVLHEWQLMAIVVPIRQDEWIIPLILRDEVAGVDQGGPPNSYDILGEYLYLKNLEATGTPVDVSVGGLEATCFIDQIQLAPDQDSKWNDARTLPESTLTVKFITLDPVA